MSGLPDFKDLPKSKQEYYAKILKYNENNPNLDVLIDRHSKISSGEIKLEDAPDPVFELNEMNSIRNNSEENSEGNRIQVQLDESDMENDNLTKDIKIKNPYKNQKHIFDTYFYVKQGLISGLDPEFLEPREQVIMRQNEGDEWYTNWDKTKTSCFPQYT